MILFDKILLIDDEDICNYVSSKILTKADISHSVESFTSARPALAYIQNRRYGENKLTDLILLDINMPGMNGWEFLEAFEKLPEDLIQFYVIIILTSSIDIRDIEKANSYRSVRKFISKPLSVEKILQGQ